jgi:hypothetical protein
VEGIHQDGVADDVNTYETLRAEDYGQVAGRIVIGPLSGKGGTNNRLEAMAISTDPDEVRAITKAAKAFGARNGRDLGDNDTERIVGEVRGIEIVPSISVEAIRRVDSEPLSEISIADGDKIITVAVDLREDAIEHAVQAISKAVGFEGKVKDWRGKALTEGEDAGAGAYMEVVHNGHIITAYAEGTSVDKASINAYVAAIDMIRRIQARTGKDNHDN